LLVKDRMTPQPLIVVTPDAPITEAQRLMQEHNIRHLPVVTDHPSTDSLAPRPLDPHAQVHRPGTEQAGETGQRPRLVGLLTRETMLQAIPWSAASLSVLETQYVLSKVKVEKVMIRDVITITEDVAVEEAARIMVDHKIGCLPVLREGTLVGIITDIDLLATTMEMLGARRPGLRLSVMVPNRVGEIARLATAIAEIGGNLSAFGTWEGEMEATSGVPEQMGIVLRVEGVSKEQLVTTVGKLVEMEILDVRGV
jgi:acetoin utilization protein AcuB